MIPDIKGKRVGYIRVSSEDQNPDRQLDGIELDKRFVDFASAKTMERPELKNMICYVREGDVIIIHSIDRIARNLRDLHKIIDELVNKRVTIYFIKENLRFDSDSTCAMSSLLINVMGSFAEFERSLIHERQMEGIRIAKEKGKYKGRSKSLKEEDVVQAKKWKEDGVAIAKIAKKFGVSRHTIYNYLNGNNEIFR